MASIALEEKINKIRQQNEEIRRRYEEVEEDKKNAAKINALVQMVPSTDWPERKEPPEFSNPPRPKQKGSKEKHEYISQTHSADSKKGDGPPPDPKYNFLADSEREEGSIEHARENAGPRAQNKVIRGSFKKRGSGRDGIQKDNRVHKGNYRDEYQPGYEAWRAERNRIDEDRISRQRTAEGNWRREWDNDKMHVADDPNKASNRPTFGEFAKKDHKDFERRYYGNGGDYSSHNRGSHRPYRGASKQYHNSYENRSHNSYDQHKHNMQMSTKTPLSLSTPDERTVIATDKNIKVTVNQPNMPKGPVMSVKVNLPSIAGTGRVGPRQRTRVTYSQSDAEGVPEVETFARQKSFDDKSRPTYFSNQKNPNIKRSHSQRTKKNETGSKSPYLQRKRDENNVNAPKYHDNELSSAYPPQSYSASKSPRSTQSTRLSGSDTSDTPNLLQEEHDRVSNDKSEELPSNHEESSIVESEESKKGCETLDVIEHINTEKNDAPAIDSEELSSNSVEAEGCTNETVISTMDTDVSTKEADISAMDTDISISTKETDISTMDTDVSTKETDTSTMDTDVSTKETEISTMDTDVSTKETDISTMDSDVSTKETDISAMDTDISTKETDISTPVDLEVAAEQIVGSAEETPNLNSGEVFDDSNKLSTLIECNAKDEAAAEDVPQNDAKLVKETVSDPVKVPEDKCDLSSSATNETPIDSQTTDVTLIQNANEQSQSENVVSTSNETQLCVSPEERAEVLSISNCDSNKDAALNEGGEIEAEKPDSAHSSEAETCAVIKSQEQTESVGLSEEINGSNQLIVEDSKLITDDNQTSVKIDDAVEIVNIERNDKAESQNESLVNSKADEEKPINN